MRQRSARITRTRKKSPLGPPGIVLVLTVLLVGLFLVMGSTLINLASSDYQVATNESRSIQALFNADAGTEEAKMRISPTAPSAAKIPIGPQANWRAYLLSGHTQAEVPTLDPTYGKAPPDYTATESTTNYVYYTTVQTGGGAIPWGWARIQHKFDSSGNILYQNTLSGQGASVAVEVTYASATDTYGNNVVNEPILVVTAEGIKGSVRRMIAMEFLPVVPTTTTVTPVSTTTTTTVVTDPFADAIHGVGNVTLVGNASTDSYDSRNGAYNVGGNRHSHGDTSTDAAGPGAVSLDGNAAINGDVQIGPGGNTSSGVQTTGNAIVTGTTSTESAVWNLPLTTIPTGVTNQGALSISGNGTRTLGAGTYWFSSISISGNGRLVTTGAVKIYVTGSISISGNGVTTAGNLPPNLLIYGTRDPTSTNPACVGSNCCTSVSISGNGNFYGAVYAPAASINVSGNGAAFGSLTGNTITINGNGGFHYDEALGHLGEITTTTTTTGTTTVTTATYNFSGYNRYSWREIAF